MPHHKIAYRTEDGQHLAERLHHAPAGGRPEIPAKGDIIELNNGRWEVKEIRLFPHTDSVIVLVVPA